MAKNQTKKSPFAQAEEEILKFWQKNKIFEKSVDSRPAKNSYVFYDGPPFATGLPHYGHILASTIKDVIPRYWTMKGYRVERRWGWDCHGLPIENIAEQGLEINSKDEIEKIGVKKFNDFCRKRVLTFAEEWGKTVRRIGRWIEFENAYKTMDNEYMESVWWAFKKIYDQGLIYEGERVLMYCTRCETPLANAEIAMDNSYRTIKEDTITVKFKLLTEDAYALAWTTTPWTLPSNLALTVNKNLDYAYVQDLSDKTVYIMGLEVVDKYFRDKSEYKIIKKVKGKELVGEKYEPLFPYYQNQKNAFQFLEGDFVTAEDGTGIVHTAPYGEDDYTVFQANDIKIVHSVDSRGYFSKEVADFAGQYIMDANPKIIDLLKKQNKVAKVEKLAHEYPFCYRCETPLIYKPIPAWFVNIQKIKKKLLKLNEKMNWYPAHLKQGRFQHTIETAPDWNISRNRYWASAMPIWKCQSCNELKVIGSIKELKKEAVDMPKQKVDLHKDFLDKIHLKCKCGQEMSRIPEVLDCWMESGSMTFAQFHYPFQNKKVFEAGFPGDFVAEYIAQTRTWFYYCLVMSALVLDDIPYKNVLATGTIMAEDGSKMSKSKGNFPDPWLIFDKYSVDTLRFYLLAGPLMKGESVNFSEREVKEIYQKFIMTLWNVVSFYKIYGDKIKPKEKAECTNVLDQWIKAKLKVLTQEVTNKMDDYNTQRSLRTILDFVQDLSTWYLRRSRDRFKRKDNICDHEAALRTLRQVLLHLSKLIAPFTPFVAERIHQELSGAGESVHLQDWPIKEKISDQEKEIMENMEQAMLIVEAGHSVRKESKIRVRQPLAQIIIIKSKELPPEIKRLVADELNVKEVVFSEAEPKGVEFIIKQGQGFKVALDTTITDELKEEGLLREFTRHINSLRKKARLTVSDQIKVYYASEDKYFDQVFDHFTDNLKKETIAQSIEKGGADKDLAASEDLKVEQKKVKVGIEKVQITRL